ncbi:4'-phosphopantetheinyl transferase family protein [Clostridium estertheticum]|uniref:4'-phosphopantetheinyl transferase family protein n=1 Tax=Clostridium estertheticum TaxID=238834 RepID=UPI001C0DAB13|nr:4'-phosphopantetheinyl transferase superfamily protein [Clostridium estertheticum]MBU3187804.1 4'-phosphopantetheinyl transferase superfamily protein [Clostridium estertheticum]
MKIYLVKILDIKEITLEMLFLFISKEKEDKIKKFVFKKDKIRSIVSEILIRSILCHQLNMENEDIIMIKNKFGKPFIEGHKDFNFNISHSGDWVICVVDDEPIGIDIQEMIYNNYIGLAQNFFGFEEIKFILSENSSECMERFYRIWTLKESYIKAEGRGLSIPLNSFSIIENEFGDIIVSTESLVKKYYFKELCVDNKYKASICSLKPHIPNDIEVISQVNLINKFLEKLKRDPISNNVISWINQS